MWPCIIIKDAFNFSLLEDIPEAECLWLNVSLPGASFVGVEYSPPSADNLVLEATLSMCQLLTGNTTSSLSVVTLTYHK